MSDNLPGKNSKTVVQVAVPAPLRRLFDYKASQPVESGVRVVVPFGRRKLTGVVVSGLPPSSSRELRTISNLPDEEAVFSPKLFELVNWSARYYHHPVGEAFQAALPARLRTPDPLLDPTLEPHYRIHSDSEEAVEKMLNRAPKQKQVFLSLDREHWIPYEALSETVPHPREILKKLQEKGLIEVSDRPAEQNEGSNADVSRVPLNAEQKQAASKIIDHLDRFTPFLLHGVTGSGKTEVYLHAAEQVINSGKQVLVLVPEIALTPQLVDRFRNRLGNRVHTVHSGMSDQQRYRTWWLARNGKAAVVLGTRSAIFTPLKYPGLIVVDEEHDISYKQQDGFRYHARDVAIKRASIENIPIVLGSATPSMESTFNIKTGRYQLLTLTRRTGSSSLPTIDTIDIKVHAAYTGISTPLLADIQQRLDKNEQTILYINRRGFAPVIQCSQCGWQALCQRCDAHLIYHQSTNQFRCHHCNSIRPKSDTCPECATELFFVGIGTQRIEDTLIKNFPEARISRLDRDEITTQNKLEIELEKIANEEVDIIIGTQLITKGHDFPKVTLVGVINSDHGLYSIDFRSPEYLFQQLVQVSGRAGRSEHPGTVLIQTAHPENHYLDYIKRQDFKQFSAHCLQERRLAQLPPYSYLVLWRAEATQNGVALQFLDHVKEIGKREKQAIGDSETVIMDAVHSPMEKLAGRYRAQLMVKSPDRKNLHILLGRWLEQVEASKQARKVRWSIDVDPMEMF